MTSMPCSSINSDCRQSISSVEIGTKSTTLATRQHSPRPTSPFSRIASSFLLTEGIIKSSRTPSNVEFSSKFYSDSFSTVAPGNMFVGFVRTPWTLSNIPMHNTRPLVSRMSARARSSGVTSSRCFVRCQVLSFRIVL